MRNYNENVNNYLSYEITEVATFELGDSISYIPFEETEANFCFLESINNINNSWEITFRVENEFNGEKYKKTYCVNKNSKLELNTFDFPLMCFLPPEKIPILAEITDITMNTVSIKIVGILEEFIQNLEK